MNLRAEPVVKVCGLTQPEDVRLAVTLGAWAVGFVLAPSPRRVTPQEAGRLAAAARAAASVAGRAAPLTVAVFGEASAEEVVETAWAIGVDAVQLHGLWSSGAGAVRAAVARLAKPGAGIGLRDAAPTGGAARQPSLLVIQAIPVPAAGDAPTEEAGPEGVAERVARARSSGADLVVLDTSQGPRFGGTGRSFPWEVAGVAAAQGPVLVAGGITPENVVEALGRSGAFGVDVSSGVEAAPGRKDPQLLERLFERVRAAHAGGKAGAAPAGSQALAVHAGGKAGVADAGGAVGSVRTDRREDTGIAGPEETRDREDRKESRN